MSQAPSEELSNSVSKLVELNKQITEAREDIKVLVQAEKALKLQVKKLMTDNGLDAINLKKGKISVKRSSRKQGLTKASVKEGLTTYFNGNEEQAESVLKIILDSLPTKESTSLSLTGIKEKKQE
jgi:cell division protein FtsB|tara:strand:- start:2436 stop:2810 length:375 start_codon:yes stop_codon:yes gene_type:complete